MASALTHCQKERGLSQWLACVHEEEEEVKGGGGGGGEDEGEGGREEEDNDDDKEETITIEGVCPPGRRRCSLILFSRRCFFGPLLLPPFHFTHFFHLPFAPLSPIGWLPMAFLREKCAGGEGENNRRKCRGRKEEAGPIRGTVYGCGSKDQLNINGR